VYNTILNFTWVLKVAIVRSPSKSHISAATYPNALASRSIVAALSIGALVQHRVHVSSQITFAIRSGCCNFVGKTASGSDPKETFKAIILGRIRYC